MSFKPDEKEWMAYLYGELEDEERERFEQYLQSSQEARTELEKYKQLRSMLFTVKDKEVIAPPIVLGDSRRVFLWDAPYFKTIASIAASLLILIVAGRLAGVHISAGNNEFKLSFGEQPVVKPQSEEVRQATLTAEQVQEMINASVKTNNEVIESEWKQNQEKLSASIRSNLASNSNKIDALVRQASAASQEQIREYVAGVQTQNMQLVKDYFQLTSTEQKTYIENLLVDFAEYLQQQRNNDLQLVQTRMNSIEQNTDLFKQETEQILTSIITTVGTPGTRETKN